jgi:hypothetical protein
MNRFTFFLSLIILVFFASLSLAEIPKMINYQGMLTQSDGTTPVNDGTYTIDFRIWNHVTSTSASYLKWTDTLSVSVSHGLFDVRLGEEKPINLPFNEQYWLEMKVGLDPPLAPRIKLTSVGYAYRASVADSAVASPPPSTGGGWTDDGTNVRLTTSTDKVGIGISSPSGKLHISTSGWDASHLYLEAPSYGHSRILQASDGLLIRNFYSTGTKTAFSFRDSADAHLMDIRADGNVGIGITSPGCKLHLASSSSSYGMLRIENSNTGDNEASIGFKEGSDAPGGDIWLAGVGSWSNTNDFVIGRGAAKFLITPDGNLGIGTTTPATKLDVASSSGTAIRAVVTGAGGWGIDASAKEGGAHIGDADGTGHAYIGHGNTGVEAYGNEQGGYFQDGDNGAYAHVGYGNCGIQAAGTEMGGHFEDSGDLSYANCGYGGYGVQAQGNSAGGCFKDKNGSGEAWVGTDHQGGWESGIDAYGNAWGGGFTDKDDGGWAWVAYYSYKIWGSGSADFVQNHPNDKNRVIVYAAPEGDEVATYTRGTARLVNGEARVMLGETFKWVTNPEIGLTAHLTPRADCKGLYVASLTTSEMVVKELQGGTSDATFDYLVYGLRIGFEEASVVQEKIREAYIPSMANHRERYNKYPELRHFNALERFKLMNAQIGKPISEMNSSQALKDAIHEFDPAIDNLPEPDKR